MSRVKNVPAFIIALVFLGWAAPARAQISLPIGPTLNGALGINNFVLQASGGTAPYHYSITPGFTAPPGFRVQDGPPLPTNFVVSANGTGGFLGVAVTSGTFTTSIRATDSLGAFIDKPITLNIPPLQMSANPPKATLGVPYPSYTFAGYGGTTYAWNQTNFPTGLGIGSSGTVSGTPTAAGTFQSTVIVTDSTLSPPLNSLSRGMTFTVDPFAITTPALLPNGTAFTPYTPVTFSAPGCAAPCTWTPTSFAGLTLNSAGVLSGTPFAQTGTFNVTATGANGSVTKVFTLFVSSPTTPLSSGFGGFSDQTFGNFVTASVLPFGGTPPYSVSLVSGTLPTGLSLVNGAGLCANCAEGLTYLAGRAMQVGSFTFTLKFTDSVGATFTPPPYTFNISPLANQYFNLPLFGSSLVVGTPYSQPLLIEGGSGTYTFRAANALPGGLSIDANTGVISGTPTTGGNVTTQIQISDGGVVKLTAFVQFSVSGPPTVVTLPATIVTSTSAVLNGTVSAAGFATTGFYEWGTTTAYGNTTSVRDFGSGFNAQPHTVGITGLTCAAGTVFHFRLRATNSQGTSFGADRTFTCAPAVSTFNAFDINAVSATLNGGVNPNGLATTANFQWGLTNSYGNTTPVQSVGAGTTQVFIESPITGLTCGTTYHFRAMATNANGTSFGNDVIFSTSTCNPFAFTGVALLVGRTDATLFGAGNPNGTSTSAHLEWGPTTAYGTSTPDQPLGSGVLPAAMTSVPISGLTCNTTYHFRTVATNSFGTANGLDRAFTTAPCVSGSFKGIVYTANGYPFMNLVYGYGVSASGALQQLPGFPMPTGGGEGADGLPETLTYDDAEHRLYVINSTDEGLLGTPSTLSVFSVDRKTGALTPMPFSPIVLPVIPNGIWTTVRVHPSGSPVVVAGGNGDPGSAYVASYVVTPTTATQAAGSPYATGLPIVYSMAFSRDGNYVYTGGGDENTSNTPSTAGFAVTAATGLLTPLGGSPFTLGGTLPIGYATDATGRLFSANNEGNQLRVFTTPGGVPTAVAGNPFSAGGSNAVSGALHPAGFYIVANSDQAGKVGVYRIMGSDSATTLTNVAGSPFMTGGADPISLTLSKEGNLAFVANASTRNLTVLGVNSSTGALTSLTVQPVDTLGNFGGLNGVAYVPSGSQSFDDLDGDGKTDLTVYRPATGTWYSLQSGSGFTTYLGQAWGVSTDKPVAGDFDGDGKNDIGVYRPSTGTWYILLSSTNFATYIQQAWGVSTDIPVPDDYDGDGKTDFGVYRPSSGTWYVLLSSTNYMTYIAQAWGVSTDIPVSGDYDGDGKADLGVYRPATGTWYVLQSSTNYATYVSQAWGVGTDVAVPGDYDGDGKTDFGVYRPATGTWYILQSSTGNATYIAQGWGVSTDVTVPGDYDGDGKADLGVYRPSTGTWYLLLSSTNYSTYLSQVWGVDTDLPLNQRH